MGPKILINHWFILIWLRGLVPRIQNMFDFVGQVAETKFWSLRLNLLMKMGGLHEGT